MTIDTGTLRKFQELWTPVIAAIPAVLDMVEREADLDRAIQSKKLELEKVQKEIDAALDEADQRLAFANSNLDAIADQKRAIQREIAEAKSKANVEASEAEQVKKAMLYALQVSIGSVQAQLQGLQAEYAAKRAEAEAAHAEAMKVLEADIAELDARKVAAETALRDIKSKLG